LTNVKVLTEHLGYLSDGIKLRAYRDAIARVVRQGDVVLDLGCGSGVLGLACLRAGASRVYFIDETPAIEIARRTMEQAGLASRAVFCRTRAQQTTLPERVDAIVCDHVGYFGIDYGILELLDDAAHRFLKPGGVVIPSELRLSICAVGSAVCRAFVSDWRGQSIPADYHWVGDIAAETRYAVTLAPGDLITGPAHLATIPLNVRSQSFLSWTAELVATRDGWVDGLAGWFECRLTGDVWMTNGPRSSDRVQRPQAFFPLATRIAVRMGDAMRVTVMARSADNLLSWAVEFPASGQRFSHSTWKGLLLDTQDLRRASPARIAALNSRGRARQIVLGYCDGTRTIAAVEQLVRRDHPDLFPSAEELSSFVTHVLAQETEA